MVCTRCRWGRIAWTLLAFVLGGVAAARTSSAFAAPIQVTPAQASLSGPEESLQLLVSSPNTGGRANDLTRSVKYRSEDAAIATVDPQGLIAPVRDGQTAVVVESEGTAVRVPVTVSGVDRPRPVSFRHEVVPIFSKTSCNSGGCHGKAEGQNGFKLSVFGFDPQADHEALAMQGRGRRLFLAAPERSLLLRKATAAEPHGGGQRLTPGSLRYRRLARWIAEGAQYEAAAPPEIARIEVEPREPTLLARGVQQLRVWAVDESGARRCVTTEAQYESNADPIAAADERGYVRASDLPGEAAILVRYSGHVAVSRITIPRSDVKFARPAEFNFIDRLAWDKLERLGIEPSGLCDDATFLRRAYLDVIGTLPTADEARAFLADRAADKRAKLVDYLLDRPEYADYWTMRFSDLLRVDQTKVTPAGAVGFTRWLRRQFAENRPYHEFVRELLTATGNVKGEGPAAYFKALDSPELLARGVSQVFLGVRIECAQCHHHPSDRWGQDDYFAFAGLFTSTNRKQLPGGGEAIAPQGGGDLSHPRSKQAVRARALGAAPIEFAAHVDRRVHLAEWMTADANPYFSRMIANRLWAHYFGRGLVEPIDDLRSTNPATNEPLLDELAKHLREKKYDLKAFTRTLLASRLYQLSSETTASNADDAQNFSHAAHKALPAEVLLDAICQATGVGESFQGWPEGHRAIQIWDNKLPSYFFRIFGRPLRATVCECERSNEPSIAQALHLMNSPEIMRKIRAKGGRAALLARQEPPAAATPEQNAERIVHELYLATLARPPRDDERAAMTAAFADGADRDDADRRAAAEDVLWALLNSKEFLYNH